jgi:hypothetical protein
MEKVAAALSKEIQGIVDSGAPRRSSGSGAPF